MQHLIWVCTVCQYKHTLDLKKNVCGHFALKGDTNIILNPVKIGFWFYTHILFT